MNPARRAVIDIGTNSIKLLVADVNGSEVHPLLEQSKQTRLGSGFYKTRHLQTAAIASTATAVAEFAATARAKSATSIHLIATSAAREAANVTDLTSAVERACGLSTTIISGEQEADWVFKGVTTDPSFAELPLLILDVGGGSAEFILGQGHEKHFSASFAIGTVRLMEQIPHSDPPTASELAACRSAVKAFLQLEIRPALALAIERETRPGSKQLQLAGTGGTASILARMELKLNSYDRALIEGATLTLDRVQWHVERLWGIPLVERQKIPGLPPDRADVILTGALIYESIMQEFGFSSLRVSTRGLRFAAVTEP